MHTSLGVYSLVSLKTLMGIVLLGVACGYQGKEKGEKRPQLAKPAILVPLV